MPTDKPVETPTETVETPTETVETPTETVETPTETTVNHFERLENDEDYRAAIDEALGGMGTAILEQIKAQREQLELLKKEKEELLKLKEEALKRDTSFLDAPEIQDLAKEAAEANAQKFNLLDPEQMQKYIDAQVAAKLNTVMQTVVEEQRKEQNVLAYEKFKAQNPEMADTTFKREMADTIKAYEANGSHITLQDALELVKAKRLVASQKKAETDRQERAKTAGAIGTGISNKDEAYPVANSIDEVINTLRNRGKLR